MKLTILQISNFFLVSIGILCSCGTETDPIQQAKSGLITDSAMVVSAHPLASKVGAEILYKGGNAIDAAIGVQFALAVVYPGAGNIGGGGFMVIREANGETATLDYREKAPKAASRDMYLDTVSNVIDELSRKGHLAAGVPGSVAGMVAAYEKYGSLPWKNLVQPAIDLANNGFALTAREARGLNRNKEAFINYNSEIPKNMINEQGWKEGDIIYYKDLAKTLSLIQAHKKDGFYDGEVAEHIVNEMRRGQGIITKEDLTSYQAVWRPAIIGEYKNYKIITMPPPSSGGVALIQLLHSVATKPLERNGHNKTKTVHLITEAERRVYADRATHMGDPDFWEVPIDMLSDPDYNLSRMMSFSEDSASLSASIYSGELLMAEQEETTHFSIVDKFGNAVSSTTTLNGGYGSKVVVGGAGFLLNNEMDDFSIKPGFPNMYGLVGGEANAIEPNKRMLSSMTPTIVEKDGNLFLVVGTPGGSTIITSVFQTILNVIEFNMNAQDAVNAKRFHHQWKPDTIFIETSAFDSITIEQIKGKNHSIIDRGAIGRVEVIKVRSEDGKLEGGADPRGDDSAAGY